MSDLTPITPSDPGFQMMEPMANGHIRDLTPITPSDPGFQMMEPMANGHIPPPAKFRPQKFLYFLRKFWWLPLVTLTFGIGTAVVIFFNTAPTFVSSGSLWETEKLRLPEGATFTDDRDNYLGTQAALLSSKKLRDLTLNRMRALNTNEIVLDQDGEPLPVDIRVDASPKSSVYVIEARSKNPAYTPAFLNALMQQYLEYRKNTRREVSSDTLASISEQVARLERDMKAGQAALTEYERSNNFAILQQESTVEASYLAKLRTELSDYQLESKLLDARELEADSGQSGSTNASDSIFDALHNSGSAVSSASGRLEAEKQLWLLKAERDQLTNSLVSTAPELVELDKKITEQQNQIEINHQQIQQQIAAARQALQIKMDSVGQFIKKWEAKLADANERLATANSLKQEVLRNQGLYDRLSALLQNVDIGRNIDQETLAILEPASPAKRSYAEAKSLLAMSVILSLGLGLGIIVLITARDDRFNSLVEVAEKFGDNVVGQVPEISGISGASSPTLLMNNDDRHMYAESYRNLRSALLYLAVEGQRPQVVLITSAVPNEGKSTVATNLARALAMGGSRVLLVDGDLRKGHVHELLKLQSKPGLSEWLRQPDVDQQFIQATDLPNFHLLSRGGIIRNPGDLLLSPALEGILKGLRKHYDHILIDSSPVFATDDTSTLAPKADGTLFVVRSHFSQARVVQEALELLSQRQARMLGLIFNRSDASARSYSFYKYGEYHTSAEVVEAMESAQPTP